MTGLSFYFKLYNDCLISDETFVFLFFGDFGLIDCFEDFYIGGLGLVGMFDIIVYWIRIGESSIIVSFICDIIWDGAFGS